MEQPMKDGESNIDRRDARYQGKKVSSGIFLSLNDLSFFSSRTPSHSVVILKLGNLMDFRARHFPEQFHLHYILVNPE